MDSPNITLRPEVRNVLRTCSVEGCNELPTDFLPGGMQVPNLIWCKPHADMLAKRISKQYYDGFIDVLRQHKISKTPILSVWTIKAEDRRCCVPGCEGSFIASWDFAPYKQPGHAIVCDRHQFAIDCLQHRLYGPRLINELRNRSSRKKTDPKAEKRKKVILELCARYHGDRNYIKAVCEGLQKRRKDMPKHWVTEWNGRFAWGLQGWDWFVAYQKREAKHRIENYISRLARLKLKSNAN